MALLALIVEHLNTEDFIIDTFRKGVGSRNERGVVHMDHFCVCAMRICDFLLFKELSRRFHACNTTSSFLVLLSIRVLQRFFAYNPHKIVLLSPVS